MFLHLLQKTMMSIRWQLVMHYRDIIMSATAPQFTSGSIVYSTCYSGTDKKHQSSASLAFVTGLHQWPVDSPHKGPITRKMFPCDDVIMDKGNDGITFANVIMYLSHVSCYWWWKMLCLVQSFPAVIVLFLARTFFAYICWKSRWRMIDL